MATPSAWRVIPEHTQQELSLLGAGLPVMLPVSTAALSFSKPERWVLQQLGWQSADFLPAHYAVCTAQVNEWTLKPSDTVSCTLFDLKAVDSGRQGEPDGTFTIRHDSSAPRAETCGKSGDSFNSSAAAEEPEGSCPAAPNKANPTRSCPYLGPGLVLGPLGRWIGAQARKWWPAAVGVKVLVRMWHIIVPTGSLTAPLCPLFNRLHMLSYDRPFNAVIAHTLSKWQRAGSWLCSLWSSSRSRLCIRPVAGIH